MFRKNLFGKQLKGVTKQIRKKFAQVVDSLQLDLRVQGTNRQQNLQKMYIELKKMSYKINEFSNLLLDDDFSFATLQDHPIILTRYCEIIFTILINTLQQESQKRAALQNQKSYNENNIYQVMAAVRLENFDLKEKINTLQNKLELSKQRAQCAQEISASIKSETSDFLKTYQQNFGLVCDLLKKAQHTQIQLLQNNRFLKQELQSLSIQFERYKEYFKMGPTLKQKEFKMKNQLEKDYDTKIKNAIKQVQITIRNQLERSVVEKFHLKDIKNLRI